MKKEERLRRARELCVLLDEHSDLIDEEAMALACHLLKITVPEGQAIMLELAEWEDGL